MKYVVYYKNWLNKWTRDTVTFTEKNKKAEQRLELIKKSKAQNGQATLQII